MNGASGASMQPHMPLSPAAVAGAVASKAAAPPAAMEGAAPSSLTPNAAIDGLLRGGAQYADLFTALRNDPDPNIQAQLAVLDGADAKALIDLCKDKGWIAQCKADPPQVKASDDAIRLKIVTAVGELANILAAREVQEVGGQKIPKIPTTDTTQAHVANGWAIFGTTSHTSDVDYAVAPIVSDRPFADNAVQGCKIAMASLIFTACCGGPSLKLLDTEFYPPHIGTFLKEDMSSRASLGAILSQMTHMLKDDELEHFQKVVEKECGASAATTAATMKEVAKDCAAMNTAVGKIRSATPDKDLANIRCTNKITLDMQKCGGEIDELTKKIKNMKDDNPKKAPLVAVRDKLLARYCYMDALRSQFLPEVFVTRGAFTVVCESQGGQKHQTAHAAIEASVQKMAGMTEAQKSQALQAANLAAAKETTDRGVNVKEATPQELLEAIGENGAYFHHRPDLVDASKYGTRVYEPALVLVDKLIVAEEAKHPKNAEFVETLKTFKRDLETKSEEMSVLESSKRGKFFEKTFTKVVAGVAKEDFQAALQKLQEAAPKLAHGTSFPAADIVSQFSAKLGELLPGVKLTNPPPVGSAVLSSQAEVDALWRALTKSVQDTPATSAESHAAKTVAVAGEFFQKAKLGGAQFQVAEPTSRVEQLAVKLGVTQLSPKMKAVAENVARCAASPLKAQAGIVLQTARDTEIAKMKATRGDLASGEALFTKVKDEVRETVAKILVYSLKAGVIKTPEVLDKKKSNLRFSKLVKPLSPITIPARGAALEASPTSH